MKTTCIIDNYNYQSYLVEAVESVLNQTTKFDEIVIVDDGSTDRSREIIQHKWSSDNRIKIIFKPNGGQMSAFNVGFEACCGELICFLDSDDIYHPSYLEKTLCFYHDYPECDFAFCGYEKFDLVNETVTPSADRPDLGITAIQVNERRTVISGPTSTLSMKRALTEKILPYPYAEEWRSRADDVLIIGSSLAGAHKFSNSEILVRYRVHTENAWYGKSFTTAIRLKRELALNRLFAHFRKTMGCREDLCNLAYLEFRTHPAPDYRLALDYCKIIQYGVKRRSKRLKYYTKILAHYLSEKRNAK